MDDWETGNWGGWDSNGYDFSGVDLSGLDLSSLDLGGLDLGNWTGLDPAAFSDFRSIIDPTDWNSFDQQTNDYVSDNYPDVMARSIYSSGIYGGEQLPEGNTVNPMYTEEQLIDNIRSRDDLSMNDKIKLLQDMKVEMGFVEPDAYAKDSPVVSPDEQTRSVATTLRTSSPLSVAQKALALSKMLQAGLMGARALKDDKGVTRSSPRGTSAPVSYANYGARQVKNLAQGGLSSPLIRGMAKGQSDKVPANLSPGEYVFDAETVSALGDGNTEAGAKELDRMRVNIRKHKRSGGLNTIAAAAKPAEQYLKGKK